jgi:Tol biopolymer transport system component
MVSWTTFVGGDSYTSSGFSTRTGILDTRTGATVPSLEEFAITRDGRRYRNADVNYWGVTFTADDNRFYATMATGGRRYLVRGDLAARTVETLKENVECPSLSPDGTRLAFKEAIDADPVKGWRLSVLDLATMRVTATAETRSVDDQAAWLDSGKLAYTLRRDDGQPDVWSVPADGSGAATLVIPGAESPSPLT